MDEVKSKERKVGFIENTARRHRRGGRSEARPKGGKPKGTLESESRNAIL